MKDAYRWLAPVYSRLSSLVFGNSLQEANQWFVVPGLEYFYVIIGGGDGESYRKWAKLLRGEFWEKSQAMLDLAKTNLAHSGLSFQLGEFGSKSNADFILLPFVLDTLKDEEIEALLQRLNGNLNLGGKLVLSDFFPPVTLWQRVLLSGMILFFRLVTSHERKDLPDYEKLLFKAGYLKIEEKTWKKGWIRSQIWTPI